MGWRRYALAMALAAAAGAVEPATPGRDQVAFVERNCLRCHGGKEVEADLDLGELVRHPVAGDRLDRWHAVVEVLEFGDMPPEDEPQPSPAARHAIVGWAKAALARAVYDPEDPGPHRPRRLTAAQAQRVLADLTGVTFPVADLLPPEGQGGEGFGGVGSIQHMPRERLEAHLRLAAHVADRLVCTSQGIVFVRDDPGAYPFAEPIALQERLRDLCRRWLRDHNRRLLEATQAVLRGADPVTQGKRWEVPVERIVETKLALTGPLPDFSALENPKDVRRHNLGWTVTWARWRRDFLELSPRDEHGPERAARLAALLEGLEAIRRSHPHRKEKEWKGVGPTPATTAALEAFPFDDSLLERIIAYRGLRDEISHVAVDRRRSDPQRTRPWLTAEQFARFSSLRAAIIESAVVANRAAGAKQRIRGQDPAELDRRRAAAREVHREWLVDFAERAWRRPLAAERRAELTAFYDARRRDGVAHQAAMRLAVTRILLAPAFWYRSEARTTQRRALDAHELADALAFTLWGRGPDARLRELAADGSLVDEATISRESRRMLVDPRAEGLIEDFLLQWWGLADFAGIPDIGRFGKVLISKSRGPIQPHMREELYHTAADVLRNDRPIPELFTAEWTYLDETLAGYYDIPGVEGPWYRMVLVREHGRGGLLGQGMVLIDTSYPLRTSPVKRGSWLLQEVLGRELPPPPPDAGLLPDDDRHPEKLTLKEQLERHRREPSCAVCHEAIDPLGFPLEGFDAIGRRRDRDINGRRIDVGTTTADGRAIDGFAGLIAWLDEDAQHQRLVRQFATKFAGYALGRKITPADAPLIDRLVEASLAAGGRISPLVETLTTSVPFRYRRGTGGEGE